MPDLNGYPEVCDNCDQRRTCNDAGYCHECEQAFREANPIDPDTDERFAQGDRDYDLSVEEGL